MTQIIDLGKLRFNFAGQWLTTTEYEANDVVKYGGNVYVYIYGLKTLGTLPTDTVYWALMVQGISFEGVYSPTLPYQIGDGVAHGGKVYIAIKDSTGIATTNTTYWSQFVDGIQYEGNYSGITAYQKNDVVVYGGSAYIAKQDTTANLPTVTSSWSKFVEGVSVKAIYNGATAYVPNDLVAYGANIYIATTESVGKLPTDVLYWRVYSSGFAYLGSWSDTTTYQVGQTITYGGSLFQAVIDSTGVNPTITASWTRIVGGISNKGAWTTSTAYAIDEVVVYGGNTYITLIPHASTVFATDLAANKWRKYNSGIRYQGTWNEAATYLIDDVVTSDASTYITVTDNTVGGLAPSAGNTGFALLAAGALGVPLINPASYGRVVASGATTSQWVGNVSFNSTISTGTGLLANTRYLCNHSAAMTLSLPASASTTNGTQVEIVDINGVFAKKLVTITSDTTIQGKSESLILDISGVTVKLVFDSILKWRLI